MLNSSALMVARIHPFGRLLLVAAALCALVQPLAAVPEPGKQAANAPRLVVFLVVDQLRTDYITDYGHTWTRGLRRLVDQGAWFTEAAYPYLKTVTCAGHATIATGAYPATHGMILNAWYDRKSRKMVNCADDPRAQVVSYGRPLRGGSSSAQNLRADTFSDVMVSQPAHKNSRVVSFSIKARSAIMLGGRKADAVTWFEPSKTVFVTSRAYTLSGVPFVRSFIEKHPVGDYIGKVWERSMPPEAYKFVDADPAERQPVGWSNTFPHVIKGDGREDSRFADEWRTSPFADEYLAEMAKDAVDQLKLGNKNRTDVLAIGFSALDTIGHDFGPRSHEVQDTLYRLDATIGSLLDHLDKNVGAGNYVVALSADHGVATIADHLKSGGEEAGTLSSSGLQVRADAALQKHFGPGKYVARVSYTDVYFEKGVEEKLLATPAAAEELRQTLLDTPGIERVFTSGQLEGKRNSSDPVERAAALSLFPGRSGDWTVIPKKNWYFGSSDATTHGTLHWYDQMVPVIFYGYGIRPGRYSSSASPADIAPTLAHLLGFKLPAAEGQVLTDALAPQQSLAGGQSRK